MPLVSVVLASYARPGQLRECLGALTEQTYPRERFEVVVVDDGGPTPLDAVVTPFASRLQLRLLRQANAGCGPARNAGAAAARGELLVFTDDDCLPAPAWLEQLASRYREDPEALLGGRIVNALANNAFSTATQRITEYVYAFAESQPGESRRVMGCNLAVPAAGFRALGGFGATYARSAGEDYDFCDRWQHAGRHVVYLPEAVVRHEHALTLGSYWRQHFHYGRGLLRYRRDAAARRGRRLRPARLAFYLGLITYPLRRDGGVRGAALSALVALAQLATLLGAAAALRPGPRSATGSGVAARAP